MVDGPEQLNAYRVSRKPFPLGLSDNGSRLAVLPGAPSFRSWGNHLEENPPAPGRKVAGEKYHSLNRELGLGNSADTFLEKLTIPLSFRKFHFLKARKWAILRIIMDDFIR